MVRTINSLVHTVSSMVHTVSSMVRTIGSMVRTVNAYCSIILRMQLLLRSATYKFPAASIAIPVG